METIILGVDGQEDQLATFSHENDVIKESNSNYEDIFPTADFYDEGGNYRTDAFQHLGGLHYMNYLHSHDDML